MPSHRSESLRAAALGFGLLLGHPWVDGAFGDDPPGRADVPAPIAGEAAPAVVLAQQELGRPAAGAMQPDLGARLLIPGTDLTFEEIERIDAELLENILRIEDPSERSLALVQAARYKLQTRDLETARRALDQAAVSALQIAEPVRRDLRLISTSEAFADLAEEEINSAVAGETGVLSIEPVELTVEERVASLDRAVESFERAAELAGQIGWLGYRPQSLYAAAEQMAMGGQGIYEVILRDPAQILDPDAILPDLRRVATRAIERAAELARSIDVPVWRDVALTSVASAAASSNQFDLGRRIALSVPGLELRFEALLVVAEAEARRGSPERATADYTEAARTVASIPIADLRSTLNDVLIESLITTGRFPDARRCIALYPDDVDRMEALGAIAESMGFRGLSDEARDWILREVEPQYRDSLYRRVNQGVLSTLERYGNESIVGGDAF